MIDKSVISYAGVGKSYYHDFTRKKSTALLNLSFEVAKGELFGIIGPNGAGKSTTIKILMGFIKADCGRVNIFDHTPADSAVHLRIGYLPENPCLYEQLTISEQLQFAGRISGYSALQTRERITALLEKVNLSHVASTPIRRFSKGMTQRAALAYALFNEPELLILDEPMSGLDPVGRQLVVDILREYNAKGHTVLFCSHILNDVERICNRIGIMNKGRLAALIQASQLSSRINQSTGNDKTPLEEFFLSTIQNDM